MKTLYPSNISTGLYPEIGCVIYVDDQNYHGNFLLKTLYQNQQPSTGKYGQTHSGKLNICSYYVALTGSTGTMFSFEVYLLCPSSSESCFFFFLFHWEAALCKDLDGSKIISRKVGEKRIADMVRPFLFL